MNQETVVLKPGDPCPICGQPIKTEDPEILRFLSTLAEFMEGKSNEIECAR